MEIIQIGEPGPSVTQNVALDSKLAGSLVPIQLQQEGVKSAQHLDLTLSREIVTGNLVKVGN